MPKKLLHSSKYTFDRLTSQITIKGNYQADQFLLITDVTENKVIYQFNDPSLGGTFFYDNSTETTVLTLTYDTSQTIPLNENGEKVDDVPHNLQIFYDKEAVMFEPTKTLLDGVGKLRVSNPENLIDTDFEYGLQSTKWETQQTVLNIPTVFSSTGDLPLEQVVSVDALEGSNQVRVVTGIPHNLSLGDPISVQGVKQYQAEGFFTISGVSDSFNFFYETDVNATATEDMSGSYTNIIPAKFYAGSGLNISDTNGVVTDGSDISVLTATTEETHGFSVGTKVYIRNTVGPKNLVVEDPTVLAPDGRPSVDVTPYFDITQPVDSTSSTGRGSFREQPIVAHDTVPIYHNYISPIDWNDVTDTITWLNHGLRNRYCLLVQTPRKNDTDGGVNDGTVYYVNKIDNDSFQLSTNYTTPTIDIVNLQPLTNNFGPIRLGLVYKIEAWNGLYRYTAFHEETVNRSTDYWAARDSIRNSWRNNLQSFFNDSPYRYTGISSTSIGDGGGDMFDGGNNMRMAVNNSYTGYINYASTGYSGLPVGNGLYASMGQVAPVAHMLISYPNQSYTYTIRTDGNNGADGGGSNSAAYIYNGTDMGNGYRAWAWYDAVYNAGDPSIYNLYVGIDNPTNWGGGITGTSNGRTANTDSNYSQFNVSGTNLVMFKILLSRSGGAQVSTSNMQRTVQRLVADLVALNLSSQSGNITEASRDQSGSDFENQQYGLGGSPGSYVIAFQGRTPGSSNQVATENFSYLTNQRNNGRHSQGKVQYNNQITSGDTGNSNYNTRGWFQINYNQSGLTTAGRTTEIFYYPASVLDGDSNTFFIQNHNYTDGDEVILNVAQADYNAGQRFVFNDSTGNSVVLSNKEVRGELTVINDDVFKVSLIDAPTTDDIASYPNNFTIESRFENELYNTIYITNHKISGLTASTYEPQGSLEPSVNNYTVTNDASVSYILNGPRLKTNSVNPSLILYEGITYNFSVNAIGHPFYLTTDDGSNYSAGTYFGEYTTGVTNSRTDSGTFTFVVPVGAPSTLYYQCGNHSVMGGSISIKTISTEIGGITAGSVYNLQRINDSRLKITNTSSTSNTVTTNAIGYANNATQVLDINLSTPLGLPTLTSASITAIQYRGDFSQNNEYLNLTFEDGDSFLIGQRGGQDSSVWQTENDFPSKNVSSLLKNVTGGKGITVTIDPTSQINFAVSGMTNWWEIRFVVSGDTGEIILTSTGTGVQQFVVDSVLGSYDGIYPITATTTNNTFQMLGKFNIPERIYEVTSTNTDAINFEITFADEHNLRTGEKISYGSKGYTPIISSDYNYDELYCIAIDEFTVRFASSVDSAKSNVGIEIIAPQVGEIHEIRTANIIKNIKGNGVISGVNGFRDIVGNGTNFLSNFKRFDKIFIESGGFQKEFIVDTITTESNMKVFETFTENFTNANYYYSTELNLRPDGFSLHLPFDGGVNITAGTSPNSKIVRQSRKYFRYQSGKGIQNSFAINFNPYRIVKRVIKADGQIATVNTQEVHNLSVGDYVNIIDAEVVSGPNTYNGEFVVETVPDAFTFTYIMASAPEQIKAGGYPKYVRKEWRDSFVRAGMFDDQNGFFYEFDGQQLSAVRRSSTLQLAGDVTVERGSQVVIGSGTSFATQIFTNEKVVLRGQSYLVVEVTSDSRLIIQPAYRGISAKNVKLTKTVDTRTYQSDFNVDKLDGTGPSGMVLDLNKIQMGYADYSWYGAGKIRYGFKDQNGEVVWCHEYKHNNRLVESYFRSGNLPGRYEIENGPSATTAPTLFHFGTSIIMDGRFDNDKAYLFTANSRQFAFTNGSNVSFTTNATSVYEQITYKGKRVWVYTLPVSEQNAQLVSSGTLVRDSLNNYLPEGTYVTQIKLAGANSKIYTNYPGLTNEPGAPLYQDIPSSTNIIAGETIAVDLTRPLPLISIRLAPSVDSSLTGAVGEREIINRMQLGLKLAGVTSNQDIEIFLILNSLPSSLNFSKVDNPSLSELLDHISGDTLIGGTTIYSLKASSGSSEIDLSELIELGNSVLGGDSIYPAGPDLLTLAVQPQDTRTINGTTPFFVSGKISWSESQA